jgi:hypothetical protein
MNSAAAFVARTIDIRPQERRRVLLMAFYLMLIIATYSATKAVRDSLFVTSIGAAQLPYVYLLIAAAMGGVSLVHSRAVQRIGLYRLIRATSLIAISNLVVFWMVFRGNTAPWFYVLYVWVSLFGAITASQFLAACDACLRSTRSTSRIPMGRVGRHFGRHPGRRGDKSVGAPVRDGVVAARVRRVDVRHPDSASSNRGRGGGPHVPQHGSRGAGGAAPRPCFGRCGSRSS